MPIVCIRFEPVDKEMMLAVAQAEYLAQQVRVNGISRRAAEQRTLEQNEKGPNVVLWVQPASYTFFIQFFFHHDQNNWEF